MEQSAKGPFPVTSAMACHISPRSSVHRRVRARLATLINSAGLTKEPFAGANLTQESDPLPSTPTQLIYTA